jgi:cellulose synthase/poly-beta-1,6-N-acetylglucosamine synthase-like glycosyltransferase
MGNNLLISRKAYASVGGFEAIPFSLTEDLMLFRKVLQEGWGFANVFDRQVLACSAPVPDLVTLLHQRKRWMKGSLNLPWYMKGMLGVYAAYFPVLLLFLAYAGLPAAGAIFIGKLILQSGFIGACFRRLHLPVPWLQLLWFEVYQFGLFLVLIVFYLLPVKVNWKGRRYAV